MDESGFALSNCRVSIVGLGLMGGSLALALRGANACREIVGVDTDPAALEMARAHAVVDRACTLEAALDCDLLVLATPVQVILSQLEQLSRLPPHGSRPVVVLDLGSTKAAIVAAMQSLPSRFDPVGGHPLCGKEVSGLVYAVAGLYQDKTFVLTPLARTSAAALALAHQLIAALGARPLVFPGGPERHDALTAVTSHLPYAVAWTLMRTAQAVGDDQVWAMAASGFRDTSRLAASDVTMMTDILLTNRAAILEALARYRAELDRLVALIDVGDTGALHAALAPAQAGRSELF